jgi:hypothetical protein
MDDELVLKVNDIIVFQTPKAIRENRISHIRIVVSIEGTDIILKTIDRNKSLMYPYKTLKSFFKMNYARFGTPQDIQYYNLSKIV